MAGSVLAAVSKRYSSSGQDISIREGLCFEAKRLARLLIAYSPIAALNRTYALAKANGKPEAIAEAEKIGLSGNYLYHSLQGELYSGIDNKKAVAHLQKALKLSKSVADKAHITNKIRAVKIIPANQRRQEPKRMSIGSPQLNRR